MKIVKPATVGAYVEQHRDAASWLRRWVEVVKAAKWKSLDDVRKTYPHADAAKVASGATVTIFNVKGNKYRLIVSIHYNTGRVFVRDFLTHAEYDAEHWKERH